MHYRYSACGVTTDGARVDFNPNAAASVTTNVDEKDSSVTKTTESASAELQSVEEKLRIDVSANSVEESDKTTVS